MSDSYWVAWTLTTYLLPQVIFLVVMVAWALGAALKFVREFFL